MGAPSRTPPLTAPPKWPLAVGDNDSAATFGSVDERRIKARVDRGNSSQVRAALAHAHARCAVLPGWNQQHDLNASCTCMPHAHLGTMHPRTHGATVFTLRCLSINFEEMVWCERVSWNAHTRTLNLCALAASAVTVHSEHACVHMRALLVH